MNKKLPVCVCSVCGGMPALVARRCHKIQMLDLVFQVFIFYRVMLIPHVVMQKFIIHVKSYLFLLCKWFYIIRHLSAHIETHSPCREYEPYKSYAMRAYTLCAFEWKIPWYSFIVSFDPATSTQSPPIDKYHNIVDSASDVTLSDGHLNRGGWATYHDVAGTTHSVLADRPLLVTWAFFLFFELELILNV